MTENSTFLQRLKDNLKNISFEQACSYTIQIACLLLSFIGIYWHIFNINIEETYTRNTLDAFTIILLGLVGAMWFHIMDLGREIDEIKKKI